MGHMDGEWRGYNTDKDAVKAWLSIAGVPGFLLGKISRNAMEQQLSLKIMQQGPGHFNVVVINDDGKQIIDGACATRVPE